MSDYKYFINFPVPKTDIPITIYYNPNCSPCNLALDLIKKHKLKDNKSGESQPLLFMAIDATEMGKILEEKNDYQKSGLDLFYEELNKFMKKNKFNSSTTTFPIIFKGTQYIGGYSELNNLLK